MKIRIQKWGNSLALRIPKSFASETRLEQDCEVDLTVENGRLVISPTARKHWNLEELLREVTPENIHGEIETGPAVGGEAW